MSSAWLLPTVLALAALVAAVTSWLVARAVIRMPHAPIDAPGPRSSHMAPTPRGGGLGIVLVGLAAIPALAWTDVLPVPWLPAVFGLALVAAVGFLDDWRPRPAWLRLLVHAGAAMILVAAAMAMEPAPPIPPALVVVAVLALVWSTNLHNFMDGINGLLAFQGVWYGLALALLFALAQAHGLALLALLIAAACLGFLPLNFPHARVFLGDGAAGFLGLAFALLALAGIRLGQLDVPQALVLSSAFLVDSGATLVRRGLRRERIWLAHREHLYQRLVASGRSHAVVTGWYMLWNLLIAVPALYLLRHRWSDPERWMIAVLVLVLALSVWLLVRARCEPAPAGAPGVPR
jgi:UDP-N-acetylmuramyl pentapeptide phosphotransferase/UDP-N-acetylglucosamine-1-phosphate transferase